ncbi:uncharacterized protein LOC131146111 [Malania oleifera]|uniref:uncharacterized protein LOC131146111 n=1 Tax=Malania oleifera TaxID=397392 RepID=UPI0025ADC3D2|nr:uncharacterized protein LOC131146111 [Malania oleifera]
MAETSSSTTASPPALQICPPAFTEGKLDGMNYTLWKFKMSAILDSYELLDTVQGMDLEPIGTHDPTNRKVIIPLDVALVKAKKRQNEDALFAIITSVSNSIRTSTLTFEEFCALLLEEEMRLRTKENESSSAFTVYIKGKDNNVEKKKGKNKKRFSGTCYYYKKRGIRNVLNCSNSIGDCSWVLDSGASQNITSKKDWYGSLKPLHETMNVIVVNNAKCPIEGTGSIFLKFMNDQGKTLLDVLYVPQIKRNILFVAAITDHDYEV